MIRRLSATQAKAQVHAGGEIAFLDLREAGPFSEGHPLFATPCPYSLLESRIGALVPRLSVPVQLIDGGDGVAEAGAAVLADMGYCDIAVVEGGTPAWVRQGIGLYQGVNVPSKTLGELVEELWRPTTIDPQTLVRWQAEGRAFDFYDCRPPVEYVKMTVPGATCLPNGELAHRLSAIAAHRPLVLTCAGRTRGIIGALGLSRLFPDRHVHALKNGTQGWALAGFDLARGNDPAPYPILDEAAHQRTSDLAADFIARENLALADAATVAAMQADGTRTTFLIDVRSADEASGDPLAAFAHALSGQIVQATDQWIGVRRARVVLADDLGLRAGLAAFWLRILGFDPYIALIDDSLRALPERPVPGPRVVLDESCYPVSALAAVRAGQARWLDIRASADYDKAHVVGAVWGIRPRLDRLAPGKRWLLIGDDTARASLAFRDLRRLGYRDVAIVRGGHVALAAAGAPLETNQPLPLVAAIDRTSFAEGRHDGNLDAARKYLNWEQGLVRQLDADERAEFRV